MSFLEELSAKLTDVKNIASQKTHELTQTVKNQNVILQEKRKQDTLFQKLGSAYYEKYRDVSDNEFQELISQLIICEQTIQSLTIDISLKTEQCKSCEKFIEKGLTFCPHCGLNLHHSADENSIEVVTSSVAVTARETIDTVNKSSEFCTNCSSILADGALFCVECGNRI
ncbi:double zinc ribbon domain-containing protein [Streptococcus rifensis]